MHSCNKRHVASAGDFFKRSLGKWLQRNLVSMTGLSIPAFMTQDSIRVGLKCCVCVLVCVCVRLCLLKQKNEPILTYLDLLLVLRLFFFLLSDKHDERMRQK